LANEARESTGIVAKVLLALLGAFVAYLVYDAVATEAETNVLITTIVLGLVYIALFIFTDISSRKEQLKPVPERVTFK